MQQVTVHPKDKPNEAMPPQYLGIIDFDSPIYRCAAVHEDDEDGLDNAKLTLISFVQDNIVNVCACQQYLFVVTGQENFRHNLAVSKPYKGQRSLEKPIHYLELFDWAIEHFECAVAEGVEADDWVVNVHQKYQGCSVLMGMDKDNLQSSGWHYNYVTHVAKFVTPFEAQWSLAYQLLAGDAGDNIPGLVGIGDAKTRKFFTANPGLPPMTVAYNEYKARGLVPDYYNEQYRLLYMLRDEMIDFESYFVQIKAATAFDEVEGEGGFEGV